MSLNKYAATAIIALSIFCCRFASAAEKVPAWLIGTWTVTADEDGTPPDFADFTADGKYINRGFDCSIRVEMPFHIYNGDIYVTAEIPKKGPIALVFRPSIDKKKLTYTSQRTRNNAVMQKIAGKKCGK